MLNNLFDHFFQWISSYCESTIFLDISIEILVRKEGKYIP